MKLAKSVAKVTAFLAPIGVFGYLKKDSIIQEFHKAYRLSDSGLSEEPKKYVLKNQLIVPHQYQKFHNVYAFDHFFEKAILKDLTGLDEYNVYIEKHFHEVLNSVVEVSEEEKREIIKNARLHCIFKPNSKLQGHIGVVHGGFQSTLYDNLTGIFSFLVGEFCPAMTAYLNLSFKKPLMVGKEYVVILEVEKLEGRKMFFRGRICDFEDNIYSTMDTLFIKVKSLDTPVMKMVVGAILKESNPIPENKEEVGMTQIYSQNHPKTSVNSTAK